MHHLNPGRLVNATIAEVSRQMATVHRVLTLSEYATRLRVPDGPHAGEPWQWREHPGQRFAVEGMDQALRGVSPYRRIVLLGPVQDGKTLTGLVLMLLYLVSQLRAPAVLGMPDLRLAGSTWRSKLRPAIIGCGEQQLLPDRGPGASGGTPTEQEFATGARLYMMGAGARNEAGQASHTARALLLDEMDAIRPRVIQTMRQRIVAYGDEGIEVDMSTIKRDAGSPIVESWQAGTAGDIYLQCPHCLKYWLPEDAHLHIGEAESELRAAAAARLVCPTGCLLDELQRRRALATARLVHRGQEVDREGVVHGEAPETTTLGIRWSALHSSIATLGTLARLRFAAQHTLEETGNHEPMRQYMRDRMTRYYDAATDDVPRVVESVIATRSAVSTYRRGEWPSGAVRAVGAVDVQKRRLYAMVLAQLSDQSVAIIDWWREAVCGDMEEPTRRQRHEALERVRARMLDGYPDDDGDVHAVERIAIDVNYATDELVPWIRQYTGVAMAVRGLDEDRHSRLAFDRGRLIYRLPGWVDERRQQAGWRLVHIDTETVRGWLHNGLVRSLGSAEAVYVPRGVATDDELARHLCAEVRSVVDDGSVVWVMRHRRNDYLDTAVYGAAVLRMLAVRGGEERMPDDLATDATAPTPAPTPRAGGGWATGGGRGRGAGWV